MRKYLLLAGAALIGISGSAYAAINCAVPPTCEELGYVLTEDDCAGRATLACPFDSSKVFCGISCEDLGYKARIRDDGSKLYCVVGQTMLYCPFDNDYIKCESDDSVSTSTLCQNAGYTKTSLSGCLSGQTKVSCPYNSLYYKCEDGATIVGPITPVETTCASKGYFLQNSSEAANCTYGIKSAGVTADDGVCYRCCAASENTTGYQCLQAGLGITRPTL